MSIRIRLARHGAKKRPFYRIVVANSEAPRDGGFLEIVGTYDPTREPAQSTFRDDKLEKWLTRGAVPSATVANLLKKRRAAAAETPANV